MEGGGERKRKSPPELDWDKLLGQDNDEDPVLLAKPEAKLAEEKSMTDGGEEPSRDDHFRQSSDKELLIEIGRMKRICPSFAANLPDRGEKFLASIKRLEEELERRERKRKRKSTLELDWDKLLGKEEDEDPVLSAKPAAKLAEEKSMTDGGEESSRDDHFRQTSDEELVIEIVRMKRTYPSLAANLPDRGENFLASIKRHEEELERRKHQKANGRCKKPTQSTDPTFVGVSDFSWPGALSSVPTSQSLSASCFSSKLDDKSGYRAANAFKKRMCALSQCDSKNVRGNVEVPQAGGIRRQQDRAPPWPVVVSDSEMETEGPSLSDCSKKMQEALHPGLVEKYKTEVCQKLGVEHFMSAALQMISIGRGLVLQGLERGETASQLVHIVQYEATKAKATKEKLEKAEVDLTTARDEIAKLTEELQQVREENTRVRLEAVEVFKGSEEYKIALGNYALESYAQGMKQARAWCRLKVPGLDTSDLAQFPLGTEDLDLTPFEEQEGKIEFGDDAEDASTPKPL